MPTIKKLMLNGVAYKFKTSPIPLGEGILQENGMETWLENGNYVDFEAVSDYYDVSTYGNSTSITRNINGAAGFAFTANGTHLITLDADASHRVIYDYALSTPYDTSTATLSTSKTVSQLSFGSGYSMCISTDENKLYISEASGNSRYIHQFTISSGTLSTFTFEKTRTFSSSNKNNLGIVLSSDGKYGYMSYSSSRIERFPLSTAWDISTMSGTSDKSYTHSLGQVLNMKVSKDGGALYFTCASGSTGYIFQCLMGTAWDISSTTTINQTLRIWPNPLGAFDFSGDLKTLYTFSYSCTQQNYWKLTHS